LRRLALAAVLGAVLAMGLQYASADAKTGTTEGKISTTVGDESNPLVGAYGPLTNAVNHVCPAWGTVTTGHLAKDDPLLNLCWYLGPTFSPLTLAVSGPATGFLAPGFFMGSSPGD
jgi:hypothetical protein